MKVSIKDSDLVTFTEEILNGKLHFLCSGCCYLKIAYKFVKLHTITQKIVQNEFLIPKKSLSLVTDFLSANGDSIYG